MKKEETINLKSMEEYDFIPNEDMVEETESSFDTVEYFFTCLGVAISLLIILSL